MTICGFSAASTLALSAAPILRAAEAFLDYHVESMHLTRLEIEAIRSNQPIATANKREAAEERRNDRRV